MCSVRLLIFVLRLYILDWFSFDTQRKSLLERRDKLERGRESIQDLMRVLDERKDNTINRTFKDVQGHFQDVFKEIVPDGQASLIMEYNNTQDATGSNTSGQAASDDSDEDEQGSSSKEKKNVVESTRSVDSYTGIAVEVSFSGTGQTKTMNQLSGGQQAVRFQLLLWLMCCLRFEKKVSINFPFLLETD